MTDSCLSTSAVRLLSALRTAEAYSPRTAVPDRRLADAASIPVRSVIDAALELVEHGHIVIAACGGPRKGRWLFDPARSSVDDLAAARAYLVQLEQRCRAIFHRRRAVRDALSRLNAHGQLALFEEGSRC